MGAFLNGDKASEKFLKTNPSVSRAEYDAEGLRQANKYKRQSTIDAFMNAWNQTANYYVFSNNRRMAKNIVRCLNAINIYAFEKKRAESEPHMNWLSPEREKRLWEEQEQGWQYLWSLELPKDILYSLDNGNRMWIHEILFEEENSYV